MKSYTSVFFFVLFFQWILLGVKGIVHLQLVPIGLHPPPPNTMEVNGDQQLKMNYLFNSW